MRVIISGAGQVGYGIAERLAAEDNDVSVIDTSAALIQRVRDTLDVRGFVGHGSHPDVLEAAVIAQPDERWGEVGCAFVLPRPGHTLPGEGRLVAYCREHLAPFKVPKRFVQVDDFPRTAAGKVRKHLLAVPDGD